MGVAGDDETFDRAAPGAFEFGGHARGGLAGAKDDGAALRWIGKTGELARRTGGGERGVEKAP